MSDQFSRDESDVRDLRKSTRYIVHPPLSGTFAFTDVVVTDLSASGIQVRHPEAVRLGTTGRLTFTLPENGGRYSLSGRVVWSHLSREPDDEGRHPFFTGLQLDEESREVAERAISRMLELSIASPDTSSLQTKRRRMHQKARERRTANTRQVFTTPLSSDQLMMINQVRQRLKTHPDEARKWYLRAKFAMKEDESRAREAPMHYREDVLAVWEYLGRTVELNTIIAVFERQLK